MQNPLSDILAKRTLSLAIAAVVMTQSGALLADEEKITVTGQSLTADSVIDQESLENYQAADLEDIFKNDPNVNVGGGFSTAQKIYVRGIEDTNLNVTIDGATQAGYLFHHQGRISVEPELLKQVEVQAGAGLATDGPGALGGAIRFITKDPEDLLRDGEQFGGMAKLGYFSNTKGLKLNTSLFGRLSDDVSVLASVTRQDSNEIKDGDGNKQKNTSSKIDSGLFKVVGHLSDDQTIRLSHDIRNDDGTRNLRPHFVEAGWNQANKQKSRRETTNFQYNLNPDNNALNLQGNLYYTKSYMTQKSDTKDNGAGVKSLGFDLKNTHIIDTHSLTYGLNFRKDTGYYINRPADSTKKDEKQDVIGIFVQDQLPLTDQLTLNTGVRYDRYTLKDNIGQKFKSDGISPNVNLNFALTDEIDIHGGYARAYRGVNIKEAYLLNYATNDANLKGQKADNLELGFDYSSGALSFGATAYVAKIKRVSTRVSGGVIQNTGDVKNKGVNLFMNYSWENTDLHLGFSHNRPELDGEPLDDGNMAIGTASGDTLTASVTHMLPEQNLELGWSLEAVKRLKKVPSDRKEKPGYAVNDVYVKWNPQGNEDLSVTLTVRNLFDRQYLSHASYGKSSSSGQIIGLAEAGRDVRLTVATRF
ncbi:TonB-dependent receptor domain-containing protein [Endozoicomonadaceae bacterium StTr2]